MSYLGIIIFILAWASAFIVELVVKPYVIKEYIKKKNNH